MKTKTLRASGSENVLGKGGLSVVLTTIDHVSYIHGTCYTAMPVRQQPARCSSVLTNSPFPWAIEHVGGKDCP